MEEEHPKKYIRTFESDIAMLKGGGTPELAPLVEPSSTPAERLVAASPEVLTQIPPSPSPTELTPEPEPPVFEPSPTPESEKSTPIETYASDFSDKVKKENASPVTVLAAEQDAAAPQRIEEPKSKLSSRRNLLYIIAGSALLVIGGVGVFVAYTHYATSLAPLVFAPANSAPIFVDEREQISGVGPVLLQAVEHSLAHPLASGTVRFLYTASATTTDNSVFSALREPAPDILLRNIQAAGSMAGIVNVGGVQSPFFILSVASYSNTFSGMLKWELFMPRDLKALFPPYPAIVPTTVIATTTTATTTEKISTQTATSTAAIVTPTPQPAPQGTFRDEVVGNHDVRVYRDSSGRSILLYGYWNQTTLIIARNPAAFAELLGRLANAQAQR